MRRVPLSVIIRSKSFTCDMNSRYCSGVQKPLTGSTTARLYQLRSKNTISPGPRQLADVALEVPLPFFVLRGLWERDDAISDAG